MTPDETYVHGRDPATARALLAAAASLGLSKHVVLTTDGGFIVPDKVWDVAEAALSAPDPEAVF